MHKLPFDLILYVEQHYAFMISYSTHTKCVYSYKALVLADFNINSSYS